jgi:hypothetical protein
MPLDAPSALLEVQSVKLSALLDAGLPAVAADPASDAPPATDSATAMRAVVANLQVDESLKQCVAVVPTFRTPLEVATFFIGVKYSELGGAAGILGSTVTAVSACPDRVGFYRHFQNGSIYWHPATGAHEVHGEIRAKWAALGWERSFLGYPTTDETVGEDAAGAGRFNLFQNGMILWYPQTDTTVASRTAAASSTLTQTARMATPALRMQPPGGGIDIDPLPKPVPPVKVPPVIDPPVVVPPPSSTAHEVHGAIAAKYRMLGAEASFLGYPTTDETATPDGIGRYNHFQAGSIYWTPGTGANEVHGLIRDYWAAHGWERNADLGYPISDELIPDRRIGHSRPDPIRKPIAAMPVDRVKLPAEAAALGFPSAVVNMPVAPAATDALNLSSTATTAVVSGGVLTSVINATSETPFPGGPFSTPAKDASRNRFSDFENGVVFWRRGDAAAAPLAPWTKAADGTSMRLTANDVIQATQPRVVQALGTVANAALTSVSFVGTTGYSFDGVGVHNRRHRLMFMFNGNQGSQFFPMPMQAAFEVQVEVAFEPIERIVTAQIVDWHTASMSPLLLGLASQMRTALDAMLWSGFKLLQVPDTNANAPIAVLSVKTMANGDVNIYIES